MLRPALCGQFLPYLGVLDALGGIQAGIVRARVCGLDSDERGGLLTVAAHGGRGQRFPGRAARFTLGRWLVALLDFKGTLPALGQLTAQVRQAGRVGFVLQGQLKRAALLADQIQVGGGIKRPLICVFTHLGNNSFTREAVQRSRSTPL